MFDSVFITKEKISPTGKIQIIMYTMVQEGFGVQSLLEQGGLTISFSLNVKDLY